MRYVAEPDDQGKWLVWDRDLNRHCEVNLAESEAKHRAQRLNQGECPECGQQPPAHRGTCS